MSDDLSLSSSEPPPSPSSLSASYFDGSSGRARAVQLRLNLIDQQLQLDGDGIALQIPIKDVRWPERTRHGVRVAHFRDGGSVQADDAMAWDQWLRASGIKDSPVVIAQQSWRGSLLALLGLLLLAVIGYLWGVPWLSRAVLTLVPPSVDRAIGDLALGSLDDTLLHPSTLDAARQQQLRSTFADAVAHTKPPLGSTPYQLRFYASPVDHDTAHPHAGLGANAFALPGGTIVVTDEIVALLNGRDDVLIGVLGHELGHVKRRHGMRLLTQAALIGGATSIAWGDFSSVLAAAPALLGQSAYSRDFEREADSDAITLLRANGISPAVMVELFTRLAAERSAQRVAARSNQPSTQRAASAPAQAASAVNNDDEPFDLGISLASHPADAQRIRSFQDAAER